MNDHAENQMQGSPGSALEVRAVALDRGWGWLMDGFDYFKRAPGPWVIMTILAAVIYIVGMWIPLIGFIAISIAAPILMGGFMLACQRQDRDETPEIADLFSGFKTRTTQLAIVGLLYLAGSFIIMLISGAMAAMFVGGGMMAGAASGYQEGMHMGMAMGLGIGMLFTALVAMALSIPLMMAIWFAPALVLFQELEPLEAMKRSFAGCLKNIVPFLIYGVLAFILCAIAAIPLGLGLLVAIPILIASAYVGYRDIFA
jgi:uncharacterized membrane protein